MNSLWQTHLTAQHIGPAVLELTASFRQHDVVWGARVWLSFKLWLTLWLPPFWTQFEQVWKSLKYQISNCIWIHLDQVDFSFDGVMLCHCLLHLLAAFHSNSCAETYRGKQTAYVLTLFAVLLVFEIALFQQHSKVSAAFSRGCSQKQLIFFHAAICTNFPHLPCFEVNRHESIMKKRTAEHPECSCAANQLRT